MFSSKYIPEIPSVIIAIPWKAEATWAVRDIVSWVASIPKNISNPIVKLRKQSCQSLVIPARKGSHKNPRKIGIKTTKMPNTVKIKS